MSVRFKVGSEYQIVAPAEAREKLGFNPGDYRLVEVRDDSIVLTSEPSDYHQQLRGLHRWDATAFVTNDRDLRRVTEMQVLLVGDYVES